MKRYKNQVGQKCDVIDLTAAGYCKISMGYTFVIYKYDTDDQYRIMEHEHFHKIFTEVENYKPELR